MCLVGPIYFLLVLTQVLRLSFESFMFASVNLVHFCTMAMSVLFPWNAINPDAENVLGFCGNLMEKEHFH